MYYFHPPPEGVHDSLEIVKVTRDTDRTRFSREMGMQILCPTWNNHEHMGNVPCWDEVREAFAENDCTDRLPWFGKYLDHAAEDEVTAEVDLDEVISSILPDSVISAAAAATAATTTADDNDAYTHHIMDKPLKVKEL